VPNPSALRVSSRSTLVVLGADLTIDGLDLDGTLVVRVQPGASLVLRNITVRNGGWSWVRRGVLGLLRRS